MVNGTDQAEAFRARDRAAFDRELPDALGVIADLEDAAAAQGDALGIGLVRFALSTHLRLAQGLAEYLALFGPAAALSCETRRPALSGDPTRPHEIKAGPALQLHAPLGPYSGLARDPRLPPGRPHP